MRHPSDHVLQELAAGGGADADRRHLEACAECREAVESYAALFGALDDLPEPASDPAFAGEVMARIDAAAAGRAPTSVRARLGTAAAAVLLVGLVGLAGGLLGSGLLGSLAADLVGAVSAGFEGLLILRQLVSGLPSEAATFLVFFQVAALIAVMAALGRLVHDRTSGLQQEAP